MQPLVIYHAGCWDGFCAAWVFRNHKDKDAEFVPARYGDARPRCADRDVYVLDFSYNAANLQSMADEACSILVLDHHKTAEADLKGLDFCVFDTNKSGARLTWEYFCGDAKSPWLVDYTEDRDLWRHALLATKEVNAALRSYQLDFDVWDALSTQSPADLAREGAAIMREQQKVVDSAVRNAGEDDIGGHRVPVVNATYMVSEIGHALCQGKPFSATYFVDKDGRKVYSLRSTDEGLDVSAIAKQYGGGGHRNAAGFKL